MVNWVKSCYQKFVHFFFFFFGKYFFYNVDIPRWTKFRKEKKNPAQRNIEHDLFALKWSLYSVAVHNRLTHDTKNKLVSCKINHDKQLSDLSALIIALLLALIIYQWTPLDINVRMIFSTCTCIFLIFEISQHYISCTRFY